MNSSIYAYIILVEVLRLFGEWVQTQIWKKTVLMDAYMPSLCDCLSMADVFNHPVGIASLYYLLLIEIPHHSQPLWSAAAKMHFSNPNAVSLAWHYNMTVLASLGIPWRFSTRHSISLTIAARR